MRAAPCTNTFRSPAAAFAIFAPLPRQSNKRIGARLFISEATVATHVRNIMNKLGFNSRA
ncbi:MAG: response regulator transcription factor [Candidatus Dormibacteria bacterium]